MPLYLWLLFPLPHGRKKREHTSVGVDVSAEVSLQGLVPTFSLFEKVLVLLGKPGWLAHEL